MNSNDSACTCGLEDLFGAADRYDGTWDVIDAECERVAICPSEALANLVAHALNAMGVDAEKKFVEHIGSIPEGRREADETPDPNHNGMTWCIKHRPDYLVGK